MIAINFTNAALYLEREGGVCMIETMSFTHRNLKLSPLGTYLVIPTFSLPWVSRRIEV